MGLALDPDALLTTTRSVRRRLDVERPVEREVLEECLAIAQQAPTGGNAQAWAFVVVTDADKRRGLAALFRDVAQRYLAANTGSSEGIRAGVQRLSDHLHEVPVHVIPCITGRTDGQPGNRQAGVWGSIMPAVWSFMLAARSRGLGTVWTTFHLEHEREAADLLGIPFDDVMQAALIPVAYSVGTDFRPAPREPLEQMVHWDSW